MTDSILKKLKDVWQLLAMLASLIAAGFSFYYQVQDIQGDVLYCHERVDKLRLKVRANRRQGEVNRVHNAALCLLVTQGDIQECRNEVWSITPESIGHVPQPAVRRNFSLPDGERAPE